MSRRLQDGAAGSRKKLPPIDAPVALLSGRFVMDPESMDLIYPPPLRERIGELVRVSAPPVTAEQVEADPSLLAGVEVLFSGWSAPTLTRRLLDAAPRLRAIFYGAGATDYFVSPEAHRRGVVVTSAISQNAIPVVEYTVAQVVMCLKRVWQHAFDARQRRAWRRLAPGATGYGSRVGLVSLGEIGSRVATRVSEMDVEVLAYDIRPLPAELERMGVRSASLEEIFRTCDVVSLHTPLRPDTRKMIGADLLHSLKAGASLINAARGKLIDHEALVDVFGRRTDLFAVLDVVDPEPLPAAHPLWGLPNVVLTPHIAGSLGGECERMGRFMLEELRRYLAGQPLRGRVEPPRGPCAAAPAERR